MKYTIIGYHFSTITCSFTGVKLKQVSDIETIDEHIKDMGHSCYEILDETFKVVLWGAKGDIKKPIETDEDRKDFVSRKENYK